MRYIGKLAPSNTRTSSDFIEACAENHGKALQALDDGKELLVGLYVLIPKAIIEQWATAFGAINFIDPEYPDND